MKLRKERINPTAVGERKSKQKKDEVMKKPN
jgi:hypothetical protein